MIRPDSDVASSLRWSVYALLFTLAIGTMLGRIFAVDSVDMLGLGRQLQKKGEKGWPLSRPFLSANDRSRWLTVRALVEDGTYAIDRVVRQPGWDTIDMVQHRGPDGQEHLYSSKPPLLATLMALPYWIVHRLTGATLQTHPYEIGRSMLVLMNVLPLLLYFIIMARLADLLAATDWARLFAVAAATFGTFLTTFSVTINNHVPAAVSAAVALYCAVRIWYEGDRHWSRFALAGFFAAFTVANELPALSLFAGLTCALLWLAPRQTLAAYLPAAAVVVAAALYTNYLAHGTMLPAYAHRGDTSGDNWYDYSYERNGQVIESYWRHPAGIDRGEASQWKYVLHATVGHHGIFSLTPIWLLSVVGIGIWLARPERRALAVLIGSISIVCLVFYLTQPPMNRNYGGMTSGFRWMFWFAPLWLVALLPTADKLAGTRLRRGLALTLLCFSVLSASYPTWNPWTHPWLTNLMMYLKWIKF